MAVPGNTTCEPGLRPPPSDARGEEPLKMDKHSEERCPPTHKCWEGTEPFTGGRARWKGTLQQQAAAAEAAKAAAEDAEPPCVWARCPWHSCALFSCSGEYDINRYRPSCKIFASPEKKVKKPWCWDPEGHLFTCLEQCRKDPYECESPRVPPPCEQRQGRDIPLFTWSHGLSRPNYGDVPFPFLSEKLQPPHPPCSTRKKFSPKFQDPNKEPSFDPCGVIVGGPGLRTRQHRLEELTNNPKRFFDKRAGGFRESEWCTPLPSGGAMTGAPSCRPCACPMR